MSYRQLPAVSKAVALALGLSFFLLAFAGGNGVDAPAPVKPKGDFAKEVRPLLKQYCLGCHSTEIKKGGLDLERFASIELVRDDLKPWQAMVEMLEAGEMPPRSKPQPTADERKQLITWVRGFLNAEAVARAGDPGRVPLRRLSNAEYNHTIRDLTGVDLQPAREFPVDGAAGEGFTNAAEALADMSPTLLNKYLTAARGIADHAVLLPDGIRFSTGKTRRDWTDECLARLRDFYREYTSDGRLPLQPYLLAAIRHRLELSGGKLTLAEVAAREKLNSKYLSLVWQILTDDAPGVPLENIRTHWRLATEKDVGAIVAEITAWQTPLWKFVPIGSYRDGNTMRQVPNDPSVAETQTLKLNVKPVPGQSEVVLHLNTRDFSSAAGEGLAVWNRPRLEGGNKPALLLRDYSTFGPQYEIDYASVFRDSAKYLTAVSEHAGDGKLPLEELAKKQDLDSDLLKRWVRLLGLDDVARETAEDLATLKSQPAVALDLLDDRNPKNDQRPAINGWKKKGTDLPVVISNSSDKLENVPGRMAPHRVTVHPTPTEFVAAAWKSPLEGKVRVAARVTHAHPGCGNGIGWWLEHRRNDKAAILAEAAVGVGGDSQVPPRIIKIDKGDLLLLAVDARDGNHVCDLTELTLTISEIDKPSRTWDLAADVADSILDANPHADKNGNKETWSFVRGPAKPAGYFSAAGEKVPGDSILGRWRAAASDPARRNELAGLAGEVQGLLAGPRPTKEKTPDRILYDNLVSVDGPLFQGMDFAHLAKPRPGPSHYGLAKEQFGRHPQGKAADEASLIVPLGTMIEIHLPAALFRDREFVVDGKLAPESADRIAAFQVLTAPSAKDAPWDGKGPLVGTPDGAAHKQILQGFARFRNAFPIFICYPRIVPEDEVVCLKLYHREDELLGRLFLDDVQKSKLDRLWEEHRFISQWPVTEHKNLPLFIGFVTQDQPKELVAYFEGMREPFRKRALEFEKEVEAAGPKQLESILNFADRAFRRPLSEKEKTDLLGLYQALRKKDVPHDDACRGVLTRVLVSPKFLFRVEEAPPGKDAGAVDDWELATRLSYFLWSSLPDEELRQSAAHGRLRDPRLLAAQAQRMLKDDRLRGLAVEFGTQWLHVRGFDELNEKNEKLFPTFDDKLRQSIYEESILLFQDLFQHDRSVTQLLDADYTYLDESLARHYGIPGVTGPQWRRVDGVKKFGRGGILGLASVLAKESGASRTSPILRGNWVVETLLGEKLPRPPKDVPRLPEAESGNDGLTVRQLVEKHTNVESCAVCHQRIDPFGFALERYDPIGRSREKDLGGLPIDTRTRLKDGTEFDGIDGLRGYLLTRKKDVFVRLFCRKLLGYALGRAVSLSDQPLIDEMVAELDRNDGHAAAAVLTIVRSTQFRSIRGREYARND
jgi:hypothetical protein